MLAGACHLNTGEVEAGESELKAILGYAAISRTVRANETLSQIDTK